MDSALESQMTLSMGPQHPSTHGVLRLDLRLDGELVIKAQVPLAEVADYQTELKAMTGGRGRYTIEFSHYDPVPANVQRQLIDAYKPRAEED